MKLANKVKFFTIRIVILETKYNKYNLERKYISCIYLIFNLICLEIQLEPDIKLKVLKINLTFLILPLDNITIL